MTKAKPRVGFLGVGWIGRSRMEAIIETGAVDVVGIAEPSSEMAAGAASLAPGAACVATLPELLDLELDGLVIATPSALHAEQAIAALRRGVAVFCQKPLGRTQREVQDVLDAAREADRLLAVDFSYRFTRGVQAIRELVQTGQLGDVFAVDLTFHNAYGPDKPWFYDFAQSGGGCLMDLGVHLVDLALWTFDFPEVNDVAGRLFSAGKPLQPSAHGVEDYAEASIELATGASVRLVCSWRISAGQDAVISANFYGTEGGAALRNVDGSFYDFVAERYRGTSREVLAEGPDPWGGRAAADWARRLASGARFDPAIDNVAKVAEILDRLYRS